MRKQEAGFFNNQQKNVLIGLLACLSLMSLLVNLEIFPGVGSQARLQGQEVRASDDCVDWVVSQAYGDPRDMIDAYMHG